METSAVYVFIMAVPSEAPEGDLDRLDWENINEIVKNLDYTSEWIEGNLYRLYYHYFYSFNQVILKLGKLSEKNESVKIIPANKHSESKLFLQIGNRIGYIYDTRSGFSFMLNQKIENPAEL
jgi:hypothetical protein